MHVIQFFYSLLIAKHFVIGQHNENPSCCQEANTRSETSESPNELKRGGFIKSSLYSASPRNPTMTPLPMATCDSVTCLPKRFSWLDHKNACPSLGQIRHQKDCGSCWAVSAAAVISDRHCLRTGEKRIFSAHELTGCTKNTLGCGGGDPIFAMEYYVQSGVVTGGDIYAFQEKGCQPYPHQQEDIKQILCKNECTASDYNIPFNKDKRKGVHGYGIKSLNVSEIKLDLINFGPNVMTLELYDDFRQHRTGIYRRTATGKRDGGHAVRLLGWGEEKGNPYWLCANSWGQDWAERGFFKIALGENHCASEEYIIGVETPNHVVTEAPIDDEPVTHPPLPQPRPNPPLPPPEPDQPDPPPRPRPRNNRPPLTIICTNFGSLNEQAVIRVNRGTITGNRNVICQNTGTVSGSSNIICHNEGYVEGSNYLCGHNHGVFSGRRPCIHDAIMLCDACDPDDPIYPFDHC